MTKTVEVKRVAHSLTGDEAEQLFATVDETGHANAERARLQHVLRREQGASVVVDPLAGEDPSGANTDQLITRSAIAFVSIFLVLVMVAQVGWGYVRRVTTSTLAEDASMRSLVSALNMGVEWGGGFTQFPSEFTVQEADENTHRIEVTVVDTASSSELDAFATAQVQASALSVNALLNPNIDTVVYHVKVRRDEGGHFQKARFFGFLRPTGAVSPFMTFVWTKTTAEDGVRFDCSITGVDNTTQERLHDAITSKSTPAAIINYVMGDSDTKVAQEVIDATQGHDTVVEGVAVLVEDVAAHAAEEAEGVAASEDAVATDDATAPAPADDVAAAQADGDALPDAAQGDASSAE